ncbi:MAG: porin family protein [Gammaproteobacteria bacterium]|nr:porin family protein [Gammaproteobacteria bacterium]
MNKKIIGLSLASLISATAFAGDYVGVSYKMIEVDAGGPAIEPSAIEAKYGHMFNDNIGLETRLGFGVGDDEGVSIDSSLGVYGVYRLKLDQMFTPYGILGYSSTEFGFDGGGFEAFNDLSYGFGVDIAIERQHAINVEFVELFDKDGIEASSFSAGWTYSF